MHGSCGPPARWARSAASGWRGARRAAAPARRRCTADGRAARGTVEDLGRMLADTGVAVIWVSHDTDQLRRLADHVIVLADGAGRSVGHLSELDASPDPLVRQSVGAP
jgi:hypothetical protein